jgi:hypothetical protein
MDMTIGDIAEISKAATEKVLEEYRRYGWQNPPTVTIAMVEAVLESAKEKGFEISDPLRHRKSRHSKF